jgi:hypothetical protein
MAKTESFYEFAGNLGWKNLREFIHRVPPEDQVNFPHEKVIWYEATLSKDCFLQINVLGGLQAAVYAIRYRICSGWHSFNPGRSLKQCRAEADRLHDRLAKEWFTSTASRRQYRMRYPQCTGYTWTKLSNEGPPVAS